jgi:uncharacterized membrane protein YfcA
MFDANRKKLVSDGPKREKTIPKLRPDLSLYLFCWAGGLVCVAIALGAALAGFYAAAALAAATAFALLAMARQMQVESRAERRAQDDRERQRRGSNRRLTER